jgi:hypothetical protein
MRSPGAAAVRAVGAIVAAIFGVILAVAWIAACQRPQPAAAPQPPPPPHPPAPAPAVHDAGPPAPDAAPDAVDAAPAHAEAAPVKPAAAHKPAAPAESGGVKIEGTLPKPEAAKVVRAGAAKLRACYERERARNPGLRGRVTFRLTVDDRGRVPLGEVVTSTLGGGDPEMCMVQAARDLRFPAGNGDSTVSFEMSFNR